VYTATHSFLFSPSIVSLYGTRYRGVDGGLWQTKEDNNPPCGRRFLNKHPMRNDRRIRQTNKRYTTLNWRQLLTTLSPPNENYVHWISIQFVYATSSSFLHTLCASCTPRTQSNCSD